MLLLSLSTIAMAANAKPIPSISNQFFLKTIEIDDTNNGSVSVHQTIIVDPINQRSHMTADGPLSGGHLEEITRCDVGWKMGYSLTLGGPPGTNVTEWQCTNRTLNPAPTSCQWSNFWSFPMNSSYQGEEEVTLYNGTKIKCDLWNYWDSNEEYSFNTLLDTAIPVRTAKIFTAVAGYHLWHIEFTDFSSGSAPVKDFDAPQGIHCVPPLAAPDATATAAIEDQKNTFSALVSTASKRFHANAKTKSILIDVSSSGDKTICKKDVDCPSSYCESHHRHFEMPPYHCAPCDNVVKNCCNSDADCEGSYCMDGPAHKAPFTCHGN
jgi:hypothetical protein